MASRKKKKTAKRKTTKKTPTRRPAAKGGSSGGGTAKQLARIADAIEKGNELQEETTAAFKESTAAYRLMVKAYEDATSPVSGRPAVNSQEDGSSSGDLFDSLGGGAPAAPAAPSKKGKGQSKPKPKTYTLEECREALKAFAGKNGKEKAVEILNNLGANILSEVAEADYPALMAELEAGS